MRVEVPGIMRRDSSLEELTSRLQKLRQSRKQYRPFSQQKSFNSAGHIRNSRNVVQISTEYQDIVNGTAYRDQVNKSIFGNSVRSQAFLIRDSLDSSLENNSPLIDLRKSTEHSVQEYYRDSGRQLRHLSTDDSSMQIILAQS